MTYSSGGIETHPEGRRCAAIALGIFVIAIGSGGLFRYLPSPVSTLTWKMFWIALCLVGIRWAHHSGPWAALGQLGLRGSAGQGMTFGFLVSMPMLATFTLTSNRNPHLEAAPLMMTGIVTPLSEELLFRGYVFLQLYRRAGWPFAAAVAATASVFGLAHLGSLAGRASLIHVAAEVGMIAAGGAFYAWLLVRWRDNLWVPIALHAFMNLWCEVYACDERSGDWRTNAGRVLTTATAVAVTVVLNRRQGVQTRAA